MKWFWYVSRSDEIFVDLDSKRAMTRAFSVLRRAMNRKDKPLDVDSIWLYPSETAGHAHLIIVLKDDMPVMERVNWALWLGSDRIRAVYVLERLRRLVLNGDILSNRSCFGYRGADYSCSCPEKHKAKKITNNCPAMKEMLADERSADYFPRNRDRALRKPLPLPWGRISKQYVKTWGKA